MGFLMVAAFMTLIMTKRMTPLSALILIPMLFGAIAGFAPALGAMALQGIRQIAPTAAMIMFAILYFGLMIDAGLFDPVVRRLLAAVGGDPVKVVVGTVVLATLVSLDGDGSTTYMVATAALLPLYKRIGLKPLVMACLIMLAASVTNITPWGGPTARVASALQLDPTSVFLSLAPAMVCAIAWLMALAYWFGCAERKRIGVLSLEPVRDFPAPQRGVWNDALRGASDATVTEAGEVTVSTDPDARRPKLLVINALMTVSLMALLIGGVLPLAVLFMCAFAIAALINYPSMEAFKARLAAHAPNALAMGSVIFAAGVFTGILSESGMVSAMSRALVDVIPVSLGPHLALITAALSLPGTFFMSNDAFYFGVVPILAEAGAHYGVSPEAIASASLIGQPLHFLSPLVPSTYLLANLSGVDFADHQRFTFVWAVATCTVLFVIAVLSGAVGLGMSR